jgi:Single-strand binding protein family
MSRLPAHCPAEVPALARRPAHDPEADHHRPAPTGKQRDSHRELTLATCHHRRQPSRDPELRFTNNRIAVANLRVAVNQRIQQDGAWRDGDTSFFKVNVWRGQAEHLADSLSKGDRVMVTGRLRQRSWETPRGEALGHRAGGR